MMRAGAFLRDDPKKDHLDHGASKEPNNPFPEAKIDFIKRVDKARITTVKDLES